MKGVVYMNEKIKLDKEEKKQAIAEIKRYFSQEREEDIGDLAAALILDFIDNKIAPVYYNRGIKDSIGFINGKLEDLHSLEIWK